MKKIFINISMMFMAVMWLTGVQAQNSNCNQQSCQATTLNISTGFDHATSTYKTPLAVESNWILTSVPASASITLPAPSWVISPNGAWANFSNAKWISPFQSNLYGVNNYPPPSTDGAFSFTNCFCVCQQSNVNINFELLVDDAALIYLDGSLIATATSGYQFQWANRLIFNQNFTLSAGQHCLRVDLYNTGSVAMGFALQGSVSGANLLSPLCCNPNGRICGIKMNDVNCDGQVDPSTDPGLSGWTIELRDNNGNLIATAVTDAQGNYCFDNLPPGVYVVNEVNQTGWTQTYPATPGTHTITLASGGAATANFGNCQQGGGGEDPCQFELKFDYKVTNCEVQFYSFINPIPAGSQIVSTHWTFGDGNSSDLLNPVHYYSAVGTYKVCFTVTMFNGEKCCTRTYCTEVKIEKPCDSGCEFQGDIKYDFNDEKCLYTFYTNMTYTGLPITSWFWDFGDGTTASGPVVNHQFPGPGVYKVCVWVFASEKDRCCFKQFCTEVSVDCDPCKGGGGPLKQGYKPAKANPSTVPAKTGLKATATDKNGVVLDQNAPNPFAESTVITYTLPASYRTAQLVFTNMQGKTVRTVNVTTKGQGKLTVYGNDLSTGVYNYSLIVDGKVIAVKRMIKN